MKIIGKYSMMGEPAKASLWYVVSNIIQKGINFLVVPIYVRMLTTAEYGKYTVFLSWRDILIIFITLNLYCGVFTKAMVDFEDERDKYTSSMQGLTTLLTAIWFLIYLLSYGLWNRLVDLDFITMSLMFVYFLVFPSFSFWSVRQRVEYKYKKLIAVSLVVSCLTPIASIFLLILTNLQEKAIIWGSLIIQIVFGLFFYIDQFFKGKCFYNKEYWFRALKFNIPIIPHYLSLIILSQVDRIMIEILCGPEYSGIYSLAYSVALLMTVITSAINSSLVPWVYDKLKTKQFSQITLISNRLCIFVGVLTFGTILLSPEIIYLIGTQEYYVAIWIIPAVGISIYYTFCYDLFSTVEFYYSRTKNIMVVSTLGAILKVILNAIFIKRFGYIAAAYTTLVCYMTLMLLHKYNVRKICKEILNGLQIFDDKFIMVASTASIVLLFLSLILYINTVIRYGVILILLILVYFFRSQIKTIFRGLR